MSWCLCSSFNSCCAAAPPQIIRPRSRGRALCPRRPRVFVPFGGCKASLPAAAGTTPREVTRIGLHGCEEGKGRHFHRRRRRDAPGRAQGLRADAQVRWLSVYTQVTGEGEQCALVVFYMYMPFRHALPTTVTPKCDHMSTIVFGTLFLCAKKHDPEPRDRAKRKFQDAPPISSLTSTTPVVRSRCQRGGSRYVLKQLPRSHRTARTSNTVVPRAMSFIPKLVVISGASKALALAFANQLLPQQVKTTIIAASRSGTSSGLEKLQNEFGAGRVFPMACDITSQEQCKAMAAQIKAEHDKQPIDMLLNVAGVLHEVGSGRHDARAQPELDRCQ